MSTEEQAAPLAATPTCPAAVGPLLASGPSYVHLSDMHLDHAGGTDASPALVAAMQQEVANVFTCANPPKFILYTGDLPAHNITGAPHVTDVQDALQDLDAIASAAKVPLLYLPGNNDSLAHDYGSFTDNAGLYQQHPLETPLSTVPTLGFPALRVAATCAPGVAAPCITSTGNPARGYYSARPVDGLRVIALNTVIFSGSYHSMEPAPGGGFVAQDTAASEQLSWLDTELKSLSPREKALIAMHIPPGISAYEDTNCVLQHSQMWTSGANGKYQDAFLATVLPRSANIVGIAYGHTHMDELRRVHTGTDDTSPVVLLAVSAPGITPGHGNNPSFKVVSYDATTMLPVDFVTLYTPIGSTAWTGGSFQMRTVFGCGATGSMLDCVTTPTTAQVAANIQKIYRAGNPPPGCGTWADPIAKAVPVFKGQ